eukprot:487843-Alexandrium_andersonii.AAC.1
MAGGKASARSQASAASASAAAGDATPAKTEAVRCKPSSPSMWSMHLICDTTSCRGSARALRLPRHRPRCRGR